MSRIADIERFYRILTDLERRVGGTRKLAACTAASGWPQRGVYFFFEPGEGRSISGNGRRVVRVGTHALTTGSKSTLWRRLSAHKGSTKTSSGSHRASIFRLLVGVALCRSGGQPVPASWGLGGHPRIAATKLGITSQEVLAEEHPLEVQVSDYLGAMPFLWLAVDDPPGSASARGVVECNCIALLSNAVPPAVDEPSRDWLGQFSDRQAVQESGLWNTNCVRKSYAAARLDVLEAWVARVAESDIAGARHS